MNGTQNYYYPKTIKMITNAVIGMWDNVIIYKFNKNGNKIKEIKVPVIYGTQTKMARARTDADVHSYYPEIPRINVVPQGMSFASDRIISPNTKRFFNDEDISFKDVDDSGEIIREVNGLFSDFSPLPYDFQFEIRVTCSTLSELSQILENTLPYFGPKNTTMRVKEFDFLNIERDLRVELGGISVDLSEEIGQEETRTVNCNFDMTVYGFIYRPIEGTKIVDSVITNIFNYTENDESVDTDVPAVYYNKGDKNNKDLSDSGELFGYVSNNEIGVCTYFEQLLNE
jgi:hypothetical protein